MPVPLGDDVPVCDAVLVHVPDELAVEERVCDADGVPVRLPDTLAVSVRVWDGDAVPVTKAAPLRLPVTLELGVPVCEPVLLRLPVALDDCVCEGLVEALGVGMCLTTCRLPPAGPQRLTVSPLSRSADPPHPPYTPTRTASMAPSIKCEPTGSDLEQGYTRCTTPSTETHRRYVLAHCHLATSLQSSSH